MSSGASIKIFSDYLAKIYNLPHKSSFINSNADTDTQDHQGKLPVQKEMEDGIGVVPKDDESKVTEVTSPSMKVEMESQQDKMNSSMCMDHDTFKKNSVIIGITPQDSTVVSSKLENIPYESRADRGLLSSSNQELVDPVNSEKIGELMTQKKIKSEVDGSSQIFENLLDRQKIEMKVSQNLNLDSLATAKVAAQDLPCPGIMQNILKATEEGIQTTQTIVTNKLVTAEENIRNPFNDETILTEQKIDPLDKQVANIKQEMLSAVFNHKGKNSNKMLKSNQHSSEKQNRDEVKTKTTEEIDTKDERVDVRKNKVVLQAIRCKDCKVEQSSKEALKMHTCYSIMDRVIQTDGGARRKSSAGEYKAGMGPSKKPVSQSANKTKPRKKVNSIIAMKDHKLAKGELLVPYEPSQDILEKKMEADRVDETKTWVKRPILKKSSQVFNYTPHIQLKIKDIEIYKTKDKSIPAKVSHSEQKKSTAQKAEFPNIGDLVLKIMKTKNLLKVDMPNQQLSQLKKKAKSQNLIFKTRYYRKLKTKKDEIYIHKTNLKIDQNVQDIDHGLKERGTQEKPSSELKGLNACEESRLSYESEKSEMLKRKAEEEVELSSTIKQMKKCAVQVGRLKLSKRQRHYLKNVRNEDAIIKEAKKYVEKNESFKKDLDQEECKDNKKYCIEKQTRKSNHIEETLESKKLKDCKLDYIQRKLNVGNEDAIIKEAEKYVEKNKSFKKDLDQEEYKDNKKCCIEKETRKSNYIEENLESKKLKDCKLDSIQRKLKETVKQKEPKDKHLLFKEGKKFEKSDKKDSVKIGPVDLTKPKPTVINHFQIYKPDIEVKSESPRNISKHAKTPPTYKEKYKSKPTKHVSKNSDKYSQSGPGSPQFKIPKYKKGEIPAKNLVGFAPNKFLQNENIKVLKVGDSTSSLLESLLTTAKLNVTKDAPYDFGSPSYPDLLQMDEIFDGISPIQNKMGTNRKHGAKEQEELNDILDEGWNEMRNLQTDPERKNLAQVQFKNPVGANPNSNLTYHGFKKRSQTINNSYVSQPSPDLWDVQKNLPMYRLSNGVIKPLQGYECKQRPKDTQINLDSEKVNSKLKTEPFANFMKTVIYNIKCMKMKRGQELQFMEELKTYLGHYKGGWEETINFLKFYQSHGEVELEDWQTREILALENQFSLFSGPGYYGETDELWCEECSKKHKFAN